jgi:hypothetical protein
VLPSSLLPLPVTRRNSNKFAGQCLRPALRMAQPGPVHLPEMIQWFALAFQSELIPSVLSLNPDIVRVFIA